MYLQITTRCNMTCEHCCFACNSKGEDMSLDTFKTALSLLQDTECELTIGGGEPTLHPDFWAMLWLAVEASDYVFIVTNGSVTKTALRLARLAKRGVIRCELSQDSFHDPIDWEVIEAFTDGLEHKRSYGGTWMYVSKNEQDRRGIRDVTFGGTNYENLSPWRDPEDGGDDDHCPCGGTLIQPDGYIRACGCLSSPVVGHVDNFNLSEYEMEREDSYGCYQNEPMYSEMETLA